MFGGAVVNPRVIDEAVERARTALARVPGIKRAILFGSAARGTAGPGSDIDILLEADESLRDRVWTTLDPIEAGLGVRISLLWWDGNAASLDRQVFDSILRQGTPLVGPMPRARLDELDLEPCQIVRFRWAGVPPRRKVAIERMLYGYTTTKRVGRRRYVRTVPGLVEKLGAERLGRGAVLVPERTAWELEKFLREHGAQRSLVAAWVQSA